MRELFATGRLMTTPAALDLMRDAAKNGDHVAVNLLARHTSGDWSEMSQGDAQANRDALHSGRRILSAYDVGTRRLWIITDADRAVTTFMLPEDY